MCRFCSLQMYVSMISSIIYWGIQIISMIVGTYTVIETEIFLGYFINKSCR
jgi:hypothetical protein